LLLASAAGLHYRVNVKEPLANKEGEAHECPQPFLCPLSQVTDGVSVRIKQLSAPPEVNHRLREMGFCEEQKIRLLRRQTTLICEVCHARLGISKRLAEKIMVEPLVRRKIA